MAAAVEEEEAAVVVHMKRKNTLHEGVHRLVLGVVVVVVAVGSGSCIAAALVRVAAGWVKALP